VQDGLSRWQQRAQTRTNAEGQYRFAELEAGKYAVSTGFHTDGLAEAESTVAYIPARYPASGGNVSSSAPAIVLKPGDHNIADLSPEVARLFPVTGTIGGYSEARGLGFHIETSSGDEITPMSHFTPRTGEFRLMLPEGSFQVTATTFAREGPQESMREITVPHGPVGGISFTMQPYASIPVEVEMQPVNQSNDTARAGGGGSPGMGPNITLVSAEAYGFTPYLSAQSVRGPREDAPGGPMVIEHVSPGAYSLRAQPNSPWYVASASCGNVDLTRDPLSISGGAAGCSIRVVMRNDSGSAHVTLRDAGQNITTALQTGAVVCALPLSNQVQPVVYFAEQNGDFFADGLAPGRYLVLALDHHQELPYRDAEAMRRYAGLGQEIVVTANGKADAEVSLVSNVPE
jgi:hypothetical protein